LLHNKCAKWRRSRDRDTSALPLRNLLTTYQLLLVYKSIGLAFLAEAKYKPDRNAVKSSYGIFKKENKTPPPPMGHRTSDGRTQLS
jgi:hypothetical protein